MLRKNTQLQESWKNRRLVWFAGGPEGPKGPEKPIEYTEKTKEADLQKIAEKIKDMKLNDGKDIKLDPKAMEKTPVTALNNSLKEQIKDYEKKNPGLNIKNLDSYLMNGLMDNVLDAKIKGPARQANLADWLKNPTGAKAPNKPTPVVGYKLVDGQWEFQVGEPPKPLAADYKLDDMNVKDDGKTVGSEKVTKVAVSREVNVQKEAEKKKAAEKAKADAVRLEGKKLLEVSTNPLEINKYKSVKELSDDLSKLTEKEPGKPALESGELQKALTDFINEVAKAKEFKGQTDAEKFGEFKKLLEGAKYEKVGIEKGLIVFIKANGEKSSNLGINVQEQVGDKKVPRPLNAYVHPNVKPEYDKLYKESADKEKKATESTQESPTPLDETEANVKKLLYGEKKEGGPDQPPLDSRYLPAYEAIMKFKGAPLTFKIPFNDLNRECTFSQNPDGRYVLSYGKEPGQNVTFPLYKNKAPAEQVKEMQLYFIRQMENGAMLQQIQQFNVQEKPNFEKFGVKIDNGPKLENGKVKYELDWPGTDPDISIQVLPHGLIRVEVVKSGIAVDGGNKYTFVAGGFPDMCRTLRSLENWNGLSKEDKANKVEEEAARRQFESEDGKILLQTQADSAKAGKLLKIDSVHPANMPYTADAKLDGQGYYLHFDWMEKHMPGTKIQVVRENDKSYTVYYAPGDRLGSAKSIGDIMKIVASQKEVMATKGGVEKLQQNLDERLKAVAPNLELRAGVVVKNIAGDRVHLAMDQNSLPSSFAMTENGFKMAAQQGYLIERNKNVDSSTGKEKPAPDPSKMPQPAEVPAKAADSKEKYSEDPKLEAYLSDKLKGIKDTGLRTMIVANLESKLAGEKVPVKAKEQTDQDFKNEQAKFDEKILSILRPFLPSESGDIQNPFLDIAKAVEEINKTYTSEKNNSAQSKFNERLKPVYGDKVPAWTEKYPTTSAFVEGLYRSISNTAVPPMEAGKFDAMRQEYLKKVSGLVDSIATGVTKDKPQLKGAALDQKIMAELKAQVLSPAKFMEKWVAEDGKRQDLERAQKDKTDYDKNQAEYEARKAAPDDYGKFESQTYLSDLSLQAKEVMGKSFESKYLDKANVTVAKVEGNSSTNNDNIFFNVKVGQAPNQVPYTINFARVNGEVVARIAEGFNNMYVQAKNVVPLKYAKANNFDPVKSLIDNVPGSRGELVKASAKPKAGTEPVQEKTPEQEKIADLDRALDKGRIESLGLKPETVQMIRNIAQPIDNASVRNDLVDHLLLGVAGNQDQTKVKYKIMYNLKKFTGDTQVLDATQTESVYDSYVKGRIDQINKTGFTPKREFSPETYNKLGIGPEFNRSRNVVDKLLEISQAISDGYADVKGIKVKGQNFKEYYQESLKTWINANCADLLKDSQNDQQVADLMLKNVITPQEFKDKWKAYKSGDLPITRSS